MNQAKDILTRLVATFVASALSVIGVSSILEQMVKSAPSLPLWYSATLAGVAAVANVVRQLAEALKDGTLTKEEIDLATAKVNASTADTNAETADKNSEA